MGSYTFTPRTEESFHDIYFDTLARDLQLGHASLRLRRVTDGSGLLQFKRPSGDVSVDMNYVTLSCEYPWSDSTQEVSPEGEMRGAILLQAGETSVSRIGTISTRRCSLGVKKQDRDLAEVCLDLFTVQQESGAKSIATAEIVIKGADEHELLYLGESLANWFGLIHVTSSSWSGTSHCSDLPNACCSTWTQA